MNKALMARMPTTPDLNQERLEQLRTLMPDLFTNEGDTDVPTFNIFDWMVKRGYTLRFIFFALHLLTYLKVLRIMYAIIETGGKQVRVEPGSKIRVERLSANVGDSVQFDSVLLVSDAEETKIGTPHVDDSPVVAKILEHGRGKKIRVIKMKRRKNYRRTYGHRQDFTEIEVLSIGATSKASDLPAVGQPEDDSATDDVAED